MAHFFIMCSKDGGNMEEEIKLAIATKENAHSTIYKVGAVLKMKSGKYYTGCNIDNQHIMSICAERVAFSKAISEGEKDFDYIITVGSNLGSEALDRCLPCGYCRQFMSEFVDDNFKIYTYYDGKLEEFTLEDLLPEAFKF